MNDDAQIVQSLVGRRIEQADWHEDLNPSTAGYGDTFVVLHLDDGRHIRIEGWGHDWWGTNVSEVEA